MSPNNHSTQVSHIKKKYGTTILRQSDFSTGTYRITNSGYYKLVGNISFEPNPNNDYRPLPNDPNYQSHAYSLGFFAAITVETKDVAIDLNGYTIEQGLVFSVAQRFYANIELASAPFIPGQGPGNFGNQIATASNCYIFNGTLGRSSHHGIHGNGNENIYLYDLTINNYEVGGIAINGVHHCNTHHCEIGPNSKDVLVLGNFSAARFLRQFYDLAYAKCLAKNGNNANLCQMDTSKINALDAVVQNVLNEVQSTGATTNELFNNPTHLPDGNNYGILVHVPGVAVNDYIEEDYKGKLSSNLDIHDIHMHDLVCHIKEIVGISLQDGTGVQNDPSGSVLQILEIMNDDTPKHNVLADAQIYLAQYVLKHGLQGQVGKLNITQDIIDWYYGNKSWDDVIVKGYKFKCNGDSMFHVNKGMHGIRLDGVRHAKIRCCKLDKISNSGFMGNSDAAGSYEKSHDLQERIGYNGDETTGIHLSYCTDVDIYNSKVYNTHSDNGESRAVRLINQCRKINIHHTKLCGITAGYHYAGGEWYGRDYYGTLEKYNNNLPNRIPNAIGILLDRNVQMKASKNKIHELQAPGYVAKIAKT